jgi:hypothetical protein
MGINGEWRIVRECPNPRICIVASKTDEAVEDEEDSIMTVEVKR